MDSAILKPLALDLLSKGKDKTFAELYEHIHDIMELRAKISNSLMVIAFLDAKISSKNLNRYLKDAISLCNSAMRSLEYMDQSPARYNMMSKLFADIFENKKAPNKSEYIKGFREAYELFKSIEEKRTPKIDQIEKVKTFLLELDKEIDQTYLKEEKLYFGYLHSTKLL